MEQASDSGLMVKIYSQDRSGTTGDSSDAYASPHVGSATLHALPGASGSWTALKHTGAHHLHARDVSCFFLTCDGTCSIVVSSVSSKME